MDSSKSTLLQQDRLASIRRRNKTIITLIFSVFVVSLALIIGGIIVSSVLEYDSSSKSPNTNLAVKEFCSCSESKLSCIASLSSSIKTTRRTYPTLVYALSLEAAIQKLSHVDLIISRSISGDIQIGSALRHCWSSLRVAIRRLDSALAVIRVYPDTEIRSLEQRKSMVLLIEKAMEALRSCDKDLLETGPTVVDGAETAVHEVGVLLRNSRDFLENFEWVDSNFFQANDGSWSMREIVENVATVSLFGSQYL